MSPSEAVSVLAGSTVGDCYHGCPWCSRLVETGCTLHPGHQQHADDCPWLAMPAIVSLVQAAYQPMVGAGSPR